jgi:GAF domain-containing protein
MPKTTTEKSGGVGSPLRRKLLVIEMLMVVLPAIAILYLFFAQKVVIDSSLVIIFVLILLLILCGAVLLRQVFDKILLVYTSVNHTPKSEQYLSEIQKDASELHEISASFRALMANFQEANNKLERRVLELFSIRELTEVASKTLDLNELLSVLLEKAMTVTDVDYGSVHMVDSQTRLFRLVSANGDLPDDGERQPPQVPDTAVFERIMKTKEPETIPLDPPPGSDRDREAPRALAMPISVREKLVAVLVLYPWPKTAKRQSGRMQILSIMIGEIGFALENAMLHAKVKQHSMNLARINQELNMASRQREQARQDLQLANAELERRVEERTRELKLTNRELRTEIAERKGPKKSSRAPKRQPRRPMPPKAGFWPT